MIGGAGVVDGEGAGAGATGEAEGVFAGAWTAAGLTDEAAGGADELAMGAGGMTAPIGNGDDFGLGLAETFEIGSFCSFTGSLFGFSGVGSFRAIGIHRISPWMPNAIGTKYPNGILLVLRRFVLERFVLGRTFITHLTESF